MAVKFWACHLLVLKTKLQAQNGIIYAKAHATNLDVKADLIAASLSSRNKNLC